MINQYDDIARRLMFDAVEWVSAADANSLWRVLKSGGFHARSMAVDGVVEPRIEETLTEGISQVGIGESACAQVFFGTIDEIAHDWRALGAPMDEKNLRAWFVSEPAVQDGVRLFMLASLGDRFDVFKQMAMAWREGLSLAPAAQ